MNAAADDTQRQLGMLMGQMAGIARRLDGIDSRLERSDESRKGLHGRMDGIAADLGEMKSDMRALGISVEATRKDVNAMMPEVELVRGIKGKAAGAIVVIGGLGAFMAWLVSNFWDAIRSGLGKLTH
jgi:hypothetical protein